MYRNGMTKADDDVGQDVLHVGPQNADGTFTYLRHKKDHEIQIGVMDPNIKDGQPIKGDLVHLTPRGPGVFDVQELYTSPKGPAKVNSTSFREGWDRIYGNKNLN